MKKKKQNKTKEDIKMVMVILMIVIIKDVVCDAKKPSTVMTIGLAMMMINSDVNIVIAKKFVD